MTVEPNGTTADMECADLERSLDAYLDGELEDRDGADALAHLARCEACRGLAERRGRVRAGLRRCLREAGGSAQRAPPALRLRIVSALRRERRLGWRRGLPLALAGLAACAVAATAVSLGRDRDVLAEEAVRRHARDLPLEVTAASVGADSVPAWFAGKLDFNPRPPRFAAPEVRLVGARLSHLSDRPAAYMRYQHPHGHVGLFIVEDPEGRFAARGRVVHAGPEVVHLVNASGYHLAVWRHGEIVYSLVADVDERELEHLVESAALAERAGSR